jgi:iron complex outermembrane receptor protein
MLGHAEVYAELMVNRRESSARSAIRQLSLDYIRGSPLIPANLAPARFSGPHGHQQRPERGRARLHRFRQ